MALSGSDGSSQTQSVHGDASGTTCLGFTVTATQSPTTTYTLTVTDKDGCVRTSNVSLNVSSVVVTITAPAIPEPCNGVLRYTASVSGFSGCTVTWTIDGLSLAAFTSGGSADDARVAKSSGTDGVNLDFRALDNTCHTILASANCSGGGSSACPGTATKTVKQCVGTSQNCTP